MKHVWKSIHFGIQLLKCRLVLFTSRCLFLHAVDSLKLRPQGAWLAGELSPVLLWTKHYTLTNLNQPWRLNTVFFKCITLTLTSLRNFNEPKVLMPFFFNQWKILKASIYFERLNFNSFFLCLCQSVRVKHEKFCTIRTCVQWQKRSRLSRWLYMN